VFVQMELWHGSTFESFR